MTEVDCFCVALKIIFCHIRNIVYFCSRKRGEIRLPKESAFSPYSDCVNLNNLHIICEVRNMEFGNAPLDCIFIYYSCGAIQNTFIFTSQGSSGPHTER